MNARAQRAILTALALALCVPAWAAENLVTNPSFEVDADGDGVPDGWSKYAHRLPDSALAALTLDNRLARGGKTSARISVSQLQTPQSLCWTTPVFSVKPGQWLLARAWVRAEGFRGKLSLLYWFGTREGKRITQIGGAISIPKEGQWERATVMVEAPPEAETARLDLTASGISNGTVWFDEVSVSCILQPPDLHIRAETVLSSAVCKFDFGGKDSQVFPGFAQSGAEDSYSADSRVGWEGVRRPVARILEGKDGKPVQWSPVNPDPLCYDFVQAEDATFRVNIPNGEYEVVLLVGDIGGRSTEVMGVKSGYRIEAGGRLVVAVAGMDGEAFRRQWLWKYCEEDWRPGRDMWDRYIAPRFRLHRFPVSVSDGRLAVRFHDCPVNMLAVYRAEDRNRIDAEVGRLDEMRRRFFPYREIRFPDSRSFPAVDEEAKRRGYIVFVKHCLDEVFPDTVPQKSEVRNEINIFAAANEYEPATFAVRALEDLKDVRVSLTDLISDNGGRLSRDNIAVTFVRYVEIAQAKAKVFRVCPHILIRGESADVPAGTNKWVWLTVHVGKGTPPGFYRGAIRIAPSQRDASEMRLTVEVFPFELPDRAADKYYGIFCHWPSPPVYGDVWGRYGARFPDLKAHGMETLYYYPGVADPTLDLKAGIVEGKVQISDWGRLPDVMALYQASGMAENRVLWNISTNLVPLAASLAGGDEAHRESVCRQLLQMIDERAKREEWPEFIYMNNASDCATPEEQLPRTELVKSAGVKVWDQQCRMETIRAVMDHTDLYVVKVPFSVILALIDEMRGKGKEVGFMNYGLGDLFFRARLLDLPLMPGAYRFFWGWWLWRTGAQVMGDEFYEVDWYGQPYNPFDAVPGEPALNDFSGVASPSPAGPRSHLRYEWMREGRDDMRYIALLEALIGGARKDRSPKARAMADEAEKLLKTMADSIKIEDYTPSKGAPWWLPEEYDRCRRTVAEQIIRLKQASGLQE